MEEEKELMELAHEPVPGYKPAFFVVFGLSLIYIVIIFASSL